MDRFFFETDDALHEAVECLREAGSRARKLLAECVECQFLTRSKVSESARKLESLGFIFIQDKSDIFSSSFEIRPSISGEEALEFLDEMDSNRKKEYLKMCELV